MLGKKILIIEDDEKQAKLIEKALERGLPNIQTSIVGDGISASQEAEFHPYDLIITDINLPRKDGMGVLKRIKYSKHNQDTPIIVVSGFIPENISREFAPLYVMEKPFRSKDIVKVANNLLKLDRKALRHNHEAFQSYIDSFESILQKAGIGIHNISQPKIREPGDDLPGDIQLFFDFEIEKSRMHFDVSISIDTFQRMYQEYSHGKKLTTETEIQLAAEDLVKLFSYEITKHFIALGERPPVFFKKDCLIDVDNASYMKAQSFRGFLLEIETSVGKAYIQTLVNPAKDLAVA